MPLSLFHFPRGPCVLVWLLPSETDRILSMESVSLKLAFPLLWFLPEFFLWVANDPYLEVHPKDFCGSQDDISLSYNRESSEESRKWPKLSNEWDHLTQLEGHNCTFYIRYVLPLFLLTKTQKRILKIDFWN